MVSLKNFRVITFGKYSVILNGFHSFIFMVYLCLLKQQFIILKEFKS